MIVLVVKACAARFFSLASAVKVLGFGMHGEFLKFRRGVEGPWVSRPRVKLWLELDIHIINFSLQNKLLNLVSLIVWRFSGTSN